jgi:hypothetical protein
MVSPKPRWGAQKTFFACSSERGLKLKLPWALSRCPGLFCEDEAPKIIGRLKQTPWCEGEGTFMENKPNPAIKQEPRRPYLTRPWVVCLSKGAYNIGARSAPWVLPQVPQVPHD